MSSVKENISDQQIQRVLSAFLGSSGSCEWKAIGQGNINDTYLAWNSEDSVIIQRINGEVFPNPRGVAENTALVSAHICNTQKRERVTAFPQVLNTVDGQNFYQDSVGDIWRAQQYLKNTVSYERVTDSMQAFEIGKCLGRFHKMVKDLSPDALIETLPGFHDLPEYFSKFNSAWSVFSGQISDELQFCLECINDNEKLISFFKDAILHGELCPAVRHGDPKVANILFDKKSGKALTLIDLDTVGPGLILQDLGDCLRSCCSRTGEDEYEAEIGCEPAYAAHLVTGYLTENTLSTFEQEHLFTSLHLITFELGLRFLTDHLEGNRYFKVQNRNDNLRRALVQFRLVRSIESQQKTLHSVIASAVRQSSK